MLLDTLEIYWSHQLLKMHRKHSDLGKHVSDDLFLCYDKKVETFVIFCHLNK